MQAKSSRFITYNVSAEVSGTTYRLYTCPDNCSAKMLLLFAANADGTTTLNIQWYRVRYGQSFTILGGKNLGAGDFVQFSDGFIVFEPGDYMTITAVSSGTPNMDVLCTVEETFKPIG